MNKIATLTLAVLFSWTAQLSAQCDSTATYCEHHMPAEYISDGQNYRALIYNDQVAEFQVTFFGNTTYRIAGCTGDSDGNLIYTLYDQDGNQLFSSADHGNAPFWDFTVEQTMDITIEARLEQRKVNSGCAVMLIGFKH